MIRNRIIPGSETDKMLDEFDAKGFVSYNRNKGKFLAVLRSNYGEYYRIFKTAHTGKRRKEFVRFGTFELFGKRLMYYYDVRRKEEFVDFLVKLFYEKNPEPDSGAKSVFTRLLNYHALSWTQKIDEKDEKYEKEKENNIS